MQSVINRLIKEGKEEAVDVYSKVPFFLRTYLSEKIDSQPWIQVSNGCMEQDKTSLDQARAMYVSLLEAADEFIRQPNQHLAGALADGSTLMMMDKCKILNEFKDDAVRFVEEVARCLQREKQLALAHSVQTDHIQDEGMDAASNISANEEDLDLKFIEDCTQNAEYQLAQARKLIEDQKSFVVVFENLIQDSENSEMGQGGRTLEELISIAAEVQSLEIIQERQVSQLKLCKEKLVEALKDISQRSSWFLDKLAKEVEIWQAAEVKWSVKVGPYMDRASLTARFKRFGDVINTVMSWFTSTGHLQVIRNVEQIWDPNHLNFPMECGIQEHHFRNIMRRLFEINLIVTNQPEGVISIENKGTKNSPSYYSRKTQLISTSLRILAGECFPSFQVLKSETELVTEKDLATGNIEPLTGPDGLSCLKADSSGGNNPHDIHFNAQVRNFCRVDQNTVYKQFCRIRYVIEVSVYDEEYTLQTFSLPFTFSTGANQILEHRGARLWYCASVPNLNNSNFQCPDVLPVDAVIKILDDRIANIVKNGRRLSEADKNFLKGRLPCTSNGTVTMQGFMKDKLKNHSSEDILNFSFFTWFFAVVNSLEQPHLVHAWQDGIIYGFCTSAHAEEVLLNPKIREGTIILRPSMTEVDKTNSAEPTAALIMMVKMRSDSNDRQFDIVPVPLKQKYIQKNSLHGAVKGVEKNEVPVAKIIYSKCGERPLDDLKNYCKSPEEETFANYKVILSKIGKFSLKISSQEKTTQEPVSNGDNRSGPGPSKRKRQFHRTFSSSSGGSSSSHSPGFPTTQSSSLISSTTSNTIQSLPGESAYSQGQRSGQRDKNIPDMPGMSTRTNGQAPPRAACETAFGNVIVDVSQIVVDAS